MILEYQNALNRSGVKNNWFDLMELMNTVAKNEERNNFWVNRQKNSKENNSKATNKDRRTRKTI